MPLSPPPRKCTFPPTNTYDGPCKVPSLKRLANFDQGNKEVTQPRVQQSYPSPTLVENRISPAPLIKNKPRHMPYLISCMNYRCLQLSIV